MFKMGDMYKRLYSTWQQPLANQTSGYSLVMLTPGDLPFFLKISLDVCATQNPEHLVETIVVPDSKLMPGFSNLLDEWAKDYPISPVRLVTLSPLEIAFNRYHPNPFNNCWHQLIRGIAALRTPYALLHDVDLFILEQDFLKKHYEACVAQDVSLMGVSKVWDGWYEQQGIDHLVATWELMFKAEWARSFQPWEHRGHRGVVAGQSHSFDMMLWPQCQTSPEQISRHEREWGFIHFNHVTSTYRRFQQSKGSYEDSYFRILLMRLLINAYDRSGWRYDIPSLAALRKGLSDSSSRVTYLQEATFQNYAEFRAKLQELIGSKLLDDEKATILSEGIAPFDRVFGKTNSPSSFRSRTLTMV